MQCLQAAGLHQLPRCVCGGGGDAVLPVDGEKRKSQLILKDRAPSVYGLAA
jgi:hypothetical protein